MATIGNEYIPTPAQKKLIEVLVNPESMGMSITSICREAGVDRTVYYDAIKIPAFVEFLNKTTIEIIKSRVNDVVNATYKYAISGSKNSADRKMLLTMAGIYADKQEMDLEAKGDIQVNFAIPRPKAKEE